MPFYLCIITNFFLRIKIIIKSESTELKTSDASFELKFLSTSSTNGAAFLLSLALWHLFLCGNFATRFIKAWLFFMNNEKCREVEGKRKLVLEEKHINMQD